MSPREFVRVSQEATSDEEPLSRGNQVLLAALHRDTGVTFGDLLRRHAPATQRLCRRSGPTTMTDLAAQFVWDEALRGLDQEDGRHGTSAWLVRVLVGYRAVARRRRLVRPAISQLRLDVQTASAEPSPTEPAPTLPLVLLRFVLLTMSPLQAQAFILVEARQMNRNEVSDILRVSAASLAVLLYRARRRLRRMLEKPISA